MPELSGFCYDYRLGYIRAGCDLPGFDVLGKDDAPGGRIVTLGGYTTPEQAKNHSSWADFLYDQLAGRFQIFNGCTDGYTSAQEMTLLIRDVILFKPKLVICLSGFYNFAYKLGLVKEKQYAQILKTHPFTTPGQIAFYQKITSRFGLGNDRVYFGEENLVPAWEYWLGHQDIIHCLCEEFGIRHRTFLQPCIFSGEYPRSRGEDIALAEAFGITDDELAMFAAQFGEQYRRAADAARNREYIADISNLFDSDNEVYLNACHVRDEYTHRIAEAIGKQIGMERLGTGGACHEA